MVSFRIKINIKPKSSNDDTPHPELPVIPKLTVRRPCDVRDERKFPPVGNGFILPHALTRDQISHVEQKINNINKRRTLNDLRKEYGAVKSGLQKSIRRGLTDEGVSYLLEGILGSLNPTGPVKGVITNVVNRLRICLVEDIMDWSMVVAAADFLKTWEAHRNQKNLTPAVASLVSLVKHMCGARKVRMVSYLKMFRDRDDINRERPSSSVAYRPALGESYDHMFAGWNDWDGRVMRDLGDVSEAYSRMIYLMERRNPNCMYWFGKLEEAGRQDLTWDYLLSQNNEQQTKTLRSLMFIQRQLGPKHKERDWCTVAGIAYVIFDDLIDWNEVRSYPAVSVSEISEYVTRALSGEIKKLPDFIAMDKHVIGSSMSESFGNLLFAAVGSRVSNINEKLFFPKMDEMYVLPKLIRAGQHPPCEPASPLKLDDPVQDFKRPLSLHEGEKTNINLPNEDDMSALYHEVVILKNNDVRRLFG